MYFTAKRGRRAALRTAPVCDVIFVSFSAVPTYVRLVFSILQLCHVVYLTPSPPLPPPPSPPSLILLIHSRAARRASYTSMFNMSHFFFFLSSLSANAIVPCIYAHVFAAEQFSCSFPDLSSIPRQSYYRLIQLQVYLQPGRVSTSGSVFYQRSQMSQIRGLYIRVA